MDGKIIFDIARGYWKSAVLMAAIDLKIFDLIEQRCFHKLANYPITFFLALEELDLIRVDIDEDNYLEDIYNFPESKAFLVSTSSDYIGHIIKHNKTIMGLSSKLSETLEKLIPAILSPQDIDYGNLLKGLDEIKPKEFDLLYTKFFLNAKTLLDIGAGTGYFSNRILEKYPHLKIDALEKHSNYNYLEVYPSINTIESYYELYSPEKKYDIIFISEVLHGETASNRSKILSKIYNDLKYNGTLIIREQFFMEDFYNLSFDFNMRLCTAGGSVLDKYKIADLLLSIGFKKIYYQNSIYGYSYIIARMIE